MRETKLTGMNQTQTDYPIFVIVLADLRLMTHFGTQTPAVTRLSQSYSLTYEKRKKKWLRIDSVVSDLSVLRINSGYPPATGSNSGNPRSFQFHLADWPFRCGSRSATQGFRPAMSIQSDGVPGDRGTTGQTY
jgi:hypothetical protein